MLRRLRAPFVLLAISLVVAFTSGSAYAQSSAGGSNGMRISPVRSDLTIKPGESQTITVYLQNITDKVAELHGVVNDFIPSADESGTPRLLLNDNDKAPSHGLKGYVDEIGTVSLRPQEQKMVKVKVAIPATAAGGGYYGAVRFLPAGSDASKNVSLTASVGSLILVTVPGDIKEQASLASFNVSRDKGKASNFFTNGSTGGNGKGLQVAIRVKNSGNVQVSPFGKMQLRKSGKLLATYEVNDTQPRGTVLPDSIRRFNVDLGKSTASFGKYTLEGNFGYGTSGQLLSAKTSFYVVPLAYLLVGAGLLLILIAALLILPRVLRSHDRKLIHKIRSHK